MKKLMILGNDARQQRAAQFLHAAGYGILSVTPEGLKDADAVILPIPVSRDGIMVEGTPFPLSALFAMVGHRTPVFAAGISPAVQKAAQGIKLIDLSADEIYVKENARLTAEGALILTANTLRKSVADSRFAVVGYGRIGQALATMFLLLGARVTVGVRRESSAERVKSLGARAVRVDTPEGRRALARGYDALINTVPVEIFDSEWFAMADGDTYLLDLASKPGGFDRRSAEKEEITIHTAPGLPAAYAPVSAGNALGRCLLRLLKESF